ncbi:MAG: hypothetical protein JO225_06740 [Candidatus Eremiobacteraeota bacterium]|nr:hypothetical protein [Candidatus Eremiobacteraeota bacterium]MBV8643596.1 hypothetical protein [Candidatus Eremiobacteraeota bacterium]
MLLASLNGGDTPAQATLVGATMVELCALLNAHKPATFANAFVAHQDGDFDTACQRIVDTLSETRVAVPVLVMAVTTLAVTSAHWILVTGAVVDDALPGAAGIKGFFIHNPAPETAIKSLPLRDHPLLHTPPLPHTEGDFCGSGRAQGAGDVFVSALTWRRHYWPAPGTPAAPPSYLSITSEQKRVAGNLVTTVRTPSETVKAPPAPEPLDGQQAFKAVLQGIADNALTTAPPFAAVLPALVNSDSLRGAEPHDVGDPFNEAWTLVQLGSPLQSLAYAFVDGAGAFLSLQTPPANTPTLDPIRFASLAVRADAAELSDIVPDHFASDLVQVEPQWFWRPCHESTSPFYPFRRATVGGRSVYVRWDGRVFRELTPIRCAHHP